MASMTEHSGIDQKFVHVMSHPVRVRALVMLIERTASPKEIAAEVDQHVAMVSHHIRELLKMGLIELVDEKQRRGAVEHFYRAVICPVLTDEESAKVSAGERQQISILILRLIFGDAAGALDAGTFDVRSDRHISRVPLSVDEDGWRELVKIQNDALDASLKVQAASAERLANSDGEKEMVHVSASMICVETPTPPDGHSSSTLSFPASAKSS